MGFAVAGMTGVLDWSRFESASCHPFRFLTMHADRFARLCFVLAIGIIIILSARFACPEICEIGFFYQRKICVSKDIFN